LKLDYRPGTASGSFEGMMAELFIFLGAFFGQLELNRFRTRAENAHSILRQTDRWPSGAAPLGFQLVDHPSGKGKALDTDPEGKGILCLMAGKLLDGWSFGRIAIWLNDDGVRTESQRKRAETPEKYGGDPARPWTVYTVKSALIGLKTQGYKV